MEPLQELANNAAEQLASMLDVMVDAAADGDGVSITEIIDEMLLVLKNTQRAVLPIVEASEEG